MLCAKDHDIELVSIVDPSSRLRTYSGIAVCVELPHSDKFDAIVVTDLGNPQREFDNLVVTFGADRVFAPGILKVSVEPEKIDDGGDND